MSDSAHLLIPFASSRDEGCAAALAMLALPHLEKLLARLAPAAIDSGDEATLSMPHERVLARACGLPADDGRIPWAAWQVAQAGREAGATAWAHITPCHWQVGQDHVAMGHPHDLQLEARESQALLAAMQPFFEGDGIALEYDSPTLWLARGEVFRDLATASLDRVVGRAVDNWIPRAPEARALRRLQQEMQMLLYTHDVNEERGRAGLAPVNSFWVSGTGALPALGQRANAARPRSHPGFARAAPCAATGTAGPRPGSSSMPPSARICCSAWTPARAVTPYPVRRSHRRNPGPGQRGRASCAAWAACSPASARKTCWSPCEDPHPRHPAARRLGARARRHPSPAGAPVRRARRAGPWTSSTTPWPACCRPPG